MSLPTAPASLDDLQHLPVPGRPRVDPGDVLVPEGYTVEVVLVGLSFPTRLFACEGGRWRRSTPRTPRTATTASRSSAST